MSPAIQLIFATFVLSMTLSYAWWLRIRVWALRQDLFTIRDRLWDRMRAEGTLDHPAHRWYRNNLNSLIRFAPALSFTTIVQMLDAGVVPAYPEGIDPDHLPEAVTQARQAADERIVKYLLFHTITGWIVIGVALSVGVKDFITNELLSHIGQIASSREIRSAGRLLATKQRNPLIPALSSSK